MFSLYDVFLVVPIAITGFMDDDVTEVCFDQRVLAGLLLRADHAMTHTRAQRMPSAAC